MTGIQFLPLIAIAVLFWLLVIRPQSRRARELRALQASLEVGDEVMLTSGILGVVRRLDDEHAYVDIDDSSTGATGGTVVKVVRAAVGVKVPRLATAGEHDVAPGTDDTTPIPPTHRERGEQENS